METTAAFGCTDAALRPMQRAENMKLTELQRNTQIILLHIRRGALTFGLTALGLLLTQFFVDVRLWITLAILGILSVTVLGDVIRYLHCVRQMKRMQPDQGAQHTANLSAG
jgi:hypothetical protein